MFNGKMLKNERIKQGFSQIQLADKAGISKQLLYKYENGIITNVPSDRIQALSKALNVSPAVLMGWEESNVDLSSPVPMYRIPVFESISAGLGCYADSKPVGYETVGMQSPIEASETMCVRVVGDSMYPKIENGDLVQIHKQTSIDSGSIAAVLVDGDEGVVKRVVYGSDWIELHSLNPLYPPRIFKGADVQRVQVVGLVKRVIRTL